MRKIAAQAKTIREVLMGQRFTIDFYQREYRWQKKQVHELIDDLAEQFLDSYSKDDARAEVQAYEHYFLGSIILSRRGGDVFIVDGQQRLTTLSLLLILLHRRQGKRDDGVKLEDLIYSERFGTKNFNIAVPERAIVMEAIFKGEAFEPGDSSESVQTIFARYQDLDDLLPEEIDERALPYFCDWLIENVHFVEIVAETDEDAYTIFETMNDRGLSLTPLDMLKGYLLASIRDTDKRNEAATLWREQIDSLRRLGKDEDADAVKAWLRGRYAQSVRERHRGAENKDFERIGSEFHRWVDKNSEALGLRTSEGCFRFVHQEMPFYSRHYQRLREASESPHAGLEPVYYVACFNFTLQYPLILAALTPHDPNELADRKIRAVAKFLDILLARRAVNYLSLNFAAMSYYIFQTMKEIRGQSPPDLIRSLYKKLEAEDCTFDGTGDGSRGGFARFALNHWSKRYVKILLARMTAYIEQQSGMPSSVATYLAGGKGRYEIEHIWADHYEQHADDFKSEADFAEARNAIGGLLLLPKSFNASYGDLPYKGEKQPNGDKELNEGKLTHYLTQNLLARSLHPQCYERNPGFMQFKERSGLPFQPHKEFKKFDLETRGKLYRRIAEMVWNPEDLLREAGQ
jgi:hypothetical protein